MNKKLYFARGTNTEFDDTEDESVVLECSDAYDVFYKNPLEQRYSKVRMRQVYSTERNGLGKASKQEVHGLWVEDGYLIPKSSIDEEELGQEGLRNLGNFLKHYRATFVDHIDRGAFYEMSVVEYENKMHVYVAKVFKDYNDVNTLYNGYLDKIYRPIVFEAINGTLDNVRHISTKLKEFQ